jgi:hypothetical protein
VGNKSVLVWVAAAADRELLEGDGAAVSGHPIPSLD